VKLKKAANISSLLTIRVADAECDLYFPDVVDDILLFTNQYDDYYVLSGGSNVIAGKIGKPVLYMGNVISGSDTDDLGEFSVKVFMPSWVSIASLLNYSITNGLSGVEFMAGIPGTVGGAIVGNAAPAGDSWDDIVAVIYVVQDGEIYPLVPEYGYRTLKNKPEKPFVVYGCELILVKDTPEGVRSRILHYLSKRPRIKGYSAGSLFKNPEGEKAGRLLEAVGMKGFSVGGAKLSENHANMVVNCGGGRYDDFCRLRDTAIGRVRERFGITLEPEVKFWS